ncbi:MAG: carbohydrate kinase family protein [Phycisphaerales bacterium]
MSSTADTRNQLAIQAADAIERVGDEGISNIKALVGFDGFVDSIIHIVDKRHSMKPDDFDRIKTIPEFAARCGAAANKSANLEMVVQDVRFGGNGPLLSSALGSLGASVTYIGAVGLEDDWKTLDPIYQPFAERCSTVYPICPPGRTDALEFEDGKIMLGKPENVQRVTWEHIKDSIGLDTLIDLFDQVSLISVVNWTLVAGVEGIWEGLCTDIFPLLAENPDRRMFLDLSDPAKRTDEDIARAMKLIQQLGEHVPVTLGLNLAESGRVASVIGVEVYNDQHNQTLASMVPQAATRIREKLGLACVVIHQHTGAGGADDQGNAHWFAGPYTRRPSISTGAGDHFGGGFSFAQSCGLDLGQCLAAACGVAGAYVRDAHSPTRTRLIEFLRDLPAPE